MSLERELTRTIRDLISESTPGLRLQAHLKGKKKLDLNVGKTYQYYDWASLTKVVSGTTLLMRALSAEKKLSLNTKIKDVVGWFPGNTTIKQHLNHTAGAIWWLPFYKSLPREGSLFEKWNHMHGLLRNEKFRGSQRAVYSDVGFIALSPLIENYFEMPLENCFNYVKEDFGLEQTFYHPENLRPFAKSKYAPTEACSWRGKVLQGQVHDDNTYALGGVSTHAGLFGPIDDLSKWFLKLREIKLKKTSFPIESRVLDSFFSRSLPRSRGDWALGFMLPTPKKSSSGSRFSSHSVGHTGFTGTSAWWDPKADLLITILSNRIHPSRNNRQYLLARPIIHDLIYDTLV